MSIGICPRLRQSGGPESGPPRMTTQAPCMNTILQKQTSSKHEASLLPGYYRTSYNCPNGLIRSCPTCHVTRSRDSEKQKNSGVVSRVPVKSPVPHVGVLLMYCCRLAYFSTVAFFLYTRSIVVTPLAPTWTIERRNNDGRKYIARDIPLLFDRQFRLYLLMQLYRLSAIA